MDNNITKRKKKPAAYCGSPTISPVKEGEGLLAKPSVGEVVEVKGREAGKQEGVKTVGKNTVSE